jgi:hypothetical protein
LICVQRTDRSVATDRHPVLVLRRQQLDGFDHVIDERSEHENFELQLHPTSLDLGEVENIVDESKQMPGRAEHASSGSTTPCCNASASSRSISLTPMMPLSGVRSSWLILAKNCDLCWLASPSCRLFSWISSKSRTFSIAITAWSAKVVTNSICLSVKRRGLEHVRPSTPAFSYQI